MLAFLMLLHPHGRYGLHANGLVKEETGCLIVGNSGQGKTTLAVGLVKAGWNYLADDALMLRCASGQIEALALRRGFSCTPQTATHFPELSSGAEEAPSLADGKKLVALDSRYPGRFSPRCIPRILLFPEIAEGRCSQLIPVNETKAMTALIKQSPGIMTRQAEVTQQLAVLNHLTRQAVSYRMLLGADVYDDPTNVSDLLGQGCGG